MPIFMDRHDMRGTSAEQIAEAHRRDVEIQDKYGVKYMTYWYDEVRGTGFCLVEAPDAATAAHVHREAHGETTADIIPIDLATVEAFLGRIGDPRLAAGDARPDMDPALRPAAWLDPAFEPHLFEPKSPLPGNGILRAETKRPKRL